MRYKIDAACYSAIGKIRKNNEDNFYFDGKSMQEKNFGTEECIITSFYQDENRLFSVFDGMGGESRGERASFLATTELKIFDKKSPIDWKEYADKSNKKICSEMDKSNRMGSTVAGIQFLEDCISIMNLGDSRIYEYNTEGLRQVSQDHTKLVDKNRKPLLTEHLGVFEDELILHPYQKLLFYEDVKKILLCSDGITDMVDDNTIEKILSENNDSKKCAELLIKESLSNGGKDNATIIVFTINNN